VWIGGDSAGVAGDFINARADRKVFCISPFIFGFSGSYRMGQILRYHFQPPVPKPDIDLEHFMVVDFIEAFRVVLKKYGWQKADDEGDACSAFLVGIYGQLYKVEGNFQIGKSLKPYNSVGAGQEIATGALYAIYQSSITVEEKLTIALNAAQEFCASVREPFHIESI
jgi:ATP-dependent protease HslVU (ClpYQ) peptidase subunit